MRTFTLLFTLHLSVSMLVSMQTTLVYVKQEKDALSAINPEDRARLIERLNLAIEYERKRRYGDLYDMMPDDCRGSASKDQWLAGIQDHSPGHLQQFLIKEANTGGDWNVPKVWEGQRWMILGCAKYQKGKKLVSYEASYRILLGSIRETGR
jgi:hypothetical protein